MFSGFVWSAVYPGDALVSSWLWVQGLALVSLLSSMAACLLSCLLHWDLLRWLS